MVKNWQRTYKKLRDSAIKQVKSLGTEEAKKKLNHNCLFKTKIIYSFSISLEIRNILLKTYGIERASLCETWTDEEVASKRLELVVMWY